MSLDTWLGIAIGVTIASFVFFGSAGAINRIHRQHIPGPATWTRTDTEALHAILRGEKDQP